jgi:hypothetical protein
MQHSDLQLYHNYNAMATNFLRIKPGVHTLYQNRTQHVPLTNSFVQIPLVSPCYSITSVSGILFLISRTVELSHVIVLVTGLVGEPVTF